MRPEPCSQAHSPRSSIDPHRDVRTERAVDWDRSGAGARRFGSAADSDHHRANSAIDSPFDVRCAKTPRCRDLEGATVGMKAHDQDARVRARPVRDAWPMRETTRRLSCRPHGGLTTLPGSDQSRRCWFEIVAQATGETAADFTSEKQTPAGFPRGRSSAILEFPNMLMDRSQQAQDTRSRHKTIFGYIKGVRCHWHLPSSARSQQPLHPYPRSLPRHRSTWRSTRSSTRLVAKPMAPSTMMPA